MSKRNDCRMCGGKNISRFLQLSDMPRAGAYLKKEDLEKNKKESEKIAKKRIKLGLILNELGEKNNLKVDEREIKNEIQKKVQSRPGQEKQEWKYYQKNRSAAESLGESI